MRFTEAYDEFIESHCERRSGERLRRLRDGLGQAEQSFLSAVWRPMFHQFSCLHPEFEIHDYKDGYRYLDFAYVQPHFRIAIEIDGFGPHWRNISAWQFADHCQRQNHLVIDGWYVIRFHYGQIQDQPRLCQQTLQQLLVRWQSGTASLAQLTVFEREIIRFAARSATPITPRNAGFLLGIGLDFTQRLLRGLTAKGWLSPASGQLRIRSYSLHPSRDDIRM